MTDNQSPDIYVGSYCFWLKKGMRYNDGQEAVLFNMRKDEGSIILKKDTKNCLDFTHILVGKGKANLEYDVSSLSSDSAHMFGFSWSVKNKEIKLYIDGEFAAKKHMKY